MRIKPTVTLLVLLASEGFGQVSKTQLNEGITPLQIATGAPAGSYRLNDFESINLYNGKVNIAVPLLDVGGRGSTAFTMTATGLNYSWSVQVTSTPVPCLDNCPTQQYTHYSGAQSRTRPGVFTRSITWSRTNRTTDAQGVPNATGSLIPAKTGQR